MISVIIPILNEERALPATLTRLFSQNAEFETIVVDGGSTDNSLNIIRQDRRIQLIQATTGRANQMNAGARQARGEWLLFLHADTLLPAGALQSIEHQPSAVKAGGFTHRFSGTGWSLRMISRLNNFRCQRTRVFYGDQAPFVRRDLFFALGEFPDQPFLEDLYFGERLAGETTPVMVDLAVITDSRKFEKQGIWKSLLRVLLILVCHELKLPITAKAFFANIR